MNIFQRRQSAASSSQSIDEKDAQIELLKRSNQDVQRKLEAEKSRTQSLEAEKAKIQTTADIFEVLSEAKPPILFQHEGYTDNELQFLMRAFFETTDNFYVELMLVFTNDELRPSVQVLPSALTRIKSANISHSTQEVTSATPLSTAINHALADAGSNMFAPMLSAPSLVRTMRAHAAHFVSLFKDPVVTPL